MYACVFCQTHYCANDCRFLDTESEYSPMTAMTRSIAETLAHALLSDPDGFTIRRDGIIPADGIYVGNPANVATFQRDSINVESVAAWIETHGDSEYFGIWTHPDGTVYLDTPDRYSQTVWDVRAALVIASVRGEYSVWDMGNGRELRTPARGTRGTWVNWRKVAGLSVWEARCGASQVVAKRQASQDAALIDPAYGKYVYSETGYGLLSELSDPNVLRALFRELSADTDAPGITYN